MSVYENEVVLGDCLDVLKQLPDNLVDSIITDPPYGLGNHEPTVEEIIAYLQGESLAHGGDFMGADWEIPSVAKWKECFRVLKPGGHLLSFGGTRTFDLISLGLRAAGFENRDTIAEDHPALQFKHGMGFPKSLNIGKAIDKLKGAEREIVGTYDPRGKFDGKQRTSAAISETWRQAEGRDDPEDRMDWSKAPITAPATPEAAHWEGYGTALKPSWEPILVFRKPISEGTIAENVLEHGTGGMNIDACRVQHSSSADFEKHKAMVDRLKEQGGSLGDSWKNSSDLSGASEVKTAGRWPPNSVMIHAEGCKKTGVKKIKAGGGIDASGALGLMNDDGWNPSVESRFNYADESGQETVEAWECVEGCPVKALDEQSGFLKSGDPSGAVRNEGGNLLLGQGKGVPLSGFGDSGGASRFFPQFEADKSSGRWPPNAVMVHAEGCKKIGTKLVQGDTHFSAQRTPSEIYGNGAGLPCKPQTERNPTKAERIEQVDAWECVEGCPVKALDEQTGVLTSGPVAPHHMMNRSTTPSDGGYHGRFGDMPLSGYGDSGGASRFFPQFEGQAPPEAPFFYTGKATKREATLDGQVPNTHPCLHPDSLVMTPDGYRPISVLSVGSWVLSADGHFHRVEAVTTHPYTSEKLVEIRVLGTNITSLVTDNHLYLIWRPVRKANAIIGGAVQWIRADEIQQGDYTMTPIVQDGLPGLTPPKPDDTDFWFLVGLYLAEGWSQKAGHGENKYPRFALHEKETDLVDRIRLCTPAKVSVYPNGEHGISVVAFDPDLGVQLAELCGSGAAYKRLHSCVWNLPQESIVSLVEGWIAGDGEVRTYFQAKTSSRDLGSQMRFLAEAIGYKVELQECSPEPGGIGGRAFKEVLPYFTLRLNSRNLSDNRTRKPSRPTLLEHEGVQYLLSYVKQVTRVSYSGNVANLSVEGSPTFQTSVGVSHNTKKPLALMQWLVKLVTPKKGIVLDPFCGSGTTCVAAIEEGMKFIGIEKDPEFHAMAVARVGLVFQKDQELQGQRDLFDEIM